VPDEKSLHVLVCVMRDRLQHSTFSNAMCDGVPRLVVRGALRHHSLACSVPSLLERGGAGPSDGVLLQLYISGYNTVFLFVFASFVYGVVRACALPRSSVTLTFLHIIYMMATRACTPWLLAAASFLQRFCHTDAC
jgi:hypothetical protein